MVAASAQLGAHEIRKRFLDFFAARGHEIVKSAPLVPRNDPTLLFVNAGMVQFKDVFTGREARPYSRATSVQRCLRAGGKHNDLDNVGFTPRHHTLFEMLGNFSFGDYFKKDAIHWAWELLTEGLGIDKRRLCVSIFDGTGERAPFDQEALELWSELLPRDRIYRYGAKDNFWAMGDTGPCGPCTEIHIFRGEVAPPDGLREGLFGPGHEDTAYVELWNLVFMQYEKLKDGGLLELPRPSIDTGAGLERLAAVCAGVESNYQTQLLAPLVACAKALAGRSASVGADESAFQVIADHARAASFLIADGVFPDRDGRSYVMRRIMRRAIRYGTQVGLDEVFFPKVCAAVVDLFGEAYPELVNARATIEEVVTGEEEAFRRTLSRGLRRLDAAFSELNEDATEFPVQVAAELYDTYGFPVDLTGVIARERKLGLDEDAVDLEVARRQGRGDGEVVLGRGTGVADVYFALSKELGAAGSAAFTGYSVEREEDIEVLALLTRGAALKGASLGGDRHEPALHIVAEVAIVGQELEVVLSRTPLYGESGGQLGDQGLIYGPNCEIEIVDCVKPNGDHHIHRGVLRRGKISRGERLSVAVDVERRAAIRRHHSATHLLHDALRAVLGTHVMQKGSLVAADRLRFDFSHSRPLSDEERREIEVQVNTQILGNAATISREMDLDSARTSGAIGLFGEKYGDQVRVVSIGARSVELCGGTHVGRAGDIGVFFIVAETGIAQGVRRIEAVSGLAAVAWVQALDASMAEAARRLHASGSAEVPERIVKLQADLKSKVVEVATLRRQLASGEGSGDVVQDVQGVKLIVRRVDPADPKAMREAADVLRDRLHSGVVVLVGEREGKANVLVAVTKDLQDRVTAGALVAQLAVHIGGKGGGRPDLAQAGGPDTSGIGALATAAPSTLAQLLGATPG